jgi:hypothetical protein
MSRRWPIERKREEDEPASPEVSRLLIMGFLIAALLGLATGVVWVAYNLVMR